MSSSTISVQKSPVDFLFDQQDLKANFCSSTSTNTTSSMNVSSGGSPNPPQLTAKPKKINFGISDFDADETVLSSKPRNPTTDLFISILQRSMKLSINKKEPSFDGLFAKPSKYSLFSSPVSPQVSSQTHLLQSIGCIFDKLLDVCLLSRSKKNFHAELKQLFGLVDNTFSLCRGSPTSNDHEKENIKNSQGQNNQITFSFKLPKPLSLVIYYHRRLSDQIFDFNHLAEESEFISDRDLSFVNLNGEIYETIMNSIGINSIPSIFQFYSPDYLSQLFKKSLKGSERTRKYKSKVLQKIEISVLNELRALTMDLDLYCRVMSAIIGVVKLHSDIASWCVGLLNDSKEQGQSLTGFQNFLLQTFESEVLSARLFIKELWDKYTHEVVCF